MIRRTIVVSLAALFVFAPTSLAAEEFGGVEFPNGESSFADSVVSFELNDATDVEPPHDEAQRVVGTPDDTAVALGNTPEEGTPSELVVSFDDNRLVDIEGNDLYIFEIGPSAEATLVSVSVDGEDWTSLGKIEGSTRGLDLAEHDAAGKEYQYVRLQDFPNGETSDSPYGGPDIDAIGAIGSEPADDGGDGGDGGGDANCPQSGSSVEHDGVTFPGGTTSFADQVAEYSPASGVSDENADSTRALGEPDGNHVSLGASEEEEPPGELTLYFRDNTLTDGEGNDLYIFEGGPDTEGTFVEVRAEGGSWYDVGKVEGSTSAIDLAEFPELPSGAEFRFVRLQIDPEENYSGAPYAGPDIDAIGAINACGVSEDVDSDGDGTPDVEDKCPLDPSVSTSEPDATGEDCDWSEATDRAPPEFEFEGCGCRASDSAPTNLPAAALVLLAAAGLAGRRRNGRADFL